MGREGDVAENAADRATENRFSVTPRVRLSRAAFEALPDLAWPPANVGVVEWKRRVEGRWYIARRVAERVVWSEIEIVEVADLDVAFDDFRERLLAAPLDERWRIETDRQLLELRALLAVLVPRG